MDGSDIFAVQDKIQGFTKKNSYVKEILNTKSMIVLKHLQLL